MSGSHKGAFLGEVDPAELTGPRYQLDVAGHYGRPDVFQLVIDRSHRPMLQAAGPLREAIDRAPPRRTLLPRGGDAPRMPELERGNRDV